MSILDNNLVYYTPVYISLELVSLVYQVIYLIKGAKDNASVRRYHTMITIDNSWRIFYAAIVFYLNRDPGYIHVLILANNARVIMYFLVSNYQISGMYQYEAKL